MVWSLTQSQTSWNTKSNGPLEASLQTKLVEVMEFQLSYLKSCESAVLNMPANLENSAMATGQEKVSFYSDPKERQCQRMFKLPHNCAHLTHWQSNAQNSLKSGFNSTWTVNFQMFKLDLEKAEEPEVRLPTSVGSLKNQNNARKTSISAVLIMPMPLTV